MSSPLHRDKQLGVAFTLCAQFLWLAALATFPGCNAKSPPIVVEPMAIVSVICGSVDSLSFAEGLGFRLTNSSRDTLWCELAPRRSFVDGPACRIQASVDGKWLGWWYPGIDGRGATVPLGPGESVYGLTGAPPPDKDFRLGFLLRNSRSQTSREAGLTWSSPIQPAELDTLFYSDFWARYLESAPWNTSSAFRRHDGGVELASPAPLGRDSLRGLPALREWLIFCGLDPDSTEFVPERERTLMSPTPYEMEPAAWGESFLSLAEFSPDSTHALQFLTDVTTWTGDQWVWDFDDSWNVWLLDLGEGIARNFLSLGLSSSVHAAQWASESEFFLFGTYRTSADLRLALWHGDLLTDTISVALGPPVQRQFPSLGREYTRWLADRYGQSILPPERDSREPQPPAIKKRRN